MVLRYVIAMGLAAGATYLGTANTSRPEPPAPEPLVRTCDYTTSEGDGLEVTQGPEGPRLGDLDYLAGNLTHEEKIKLVSSPQFDSVGVLETMANDLVRNHDRVARDIYRSVQRALEEGF